MSISFDREGGTIGRLPEPQNTFHLPDPDKYISRKHAVIRYENGCYYLTDTSAAGTFFTNKNMTVHQDSTQLTDGDRLRIGEYELIVSITGSGILDTPSSEAVSREDDSLFFNFDQDRGVNDDPGINNLTAEDDVFSWPPDEITDPGSKRIPSKDLNEGSPLDESFVPPDIMPPKPRREIPPDFDFRDLIGDTDQKENNVFPKSDVAGEGTPKGPDEQWFPNRELNEPYLNRAIDRSREGRVVKNKPEVPARQTEERPTLDGSGKSRPHPPDATDDLLRVFFKAAGVEDISSLPVVKYPELMRTAGALFRELIAGLMTVLKGRSELKAQLRVPVTVLRPTDNNLFKFSAGVDEALKLLLTENSSGFVDAVEAAREGYQDVMHHELAITAAVQASLMNVLKRFEPRQFEKKYQEGIVIQKRAKCWDTYSRAYGEIVKEALEKFFGDAFVQAYEDQLLKLRTTRTTPTRG
jgi:type VI secretion system FHA domain protein